MTRRSSRLGMAALGLLTGMFVLLPATAASAHAKPVSTFPAAGGTTAGDIDHVSVTFDEPVELVPRALTLTTDLGVPVDLGRPRLLGGGRTLLARVEDKLGGGGYRIGWRALADDGHIEGGSFAFQIGGGSGAGVAAPRPQQSTALPLAPAPSQPVWPVIVAAALALAALTGAAVVVRQGLRQVSEPFDPYGAPDPSRADDTPLRRRDAASHLRT